MDKIRIGVIGGGLIAQAAHLPNLRRLDDRFELTSLADPSPRIRETVGARFAVPRTYPGWQQLLDAETLDAIAVCTPHSAHTDVILAALEQGVHVFVEKPLCVRLEDADRIVAAQERSGCVVEVGYMKRYDPAYEALVEEVLAGGQDLRHVAILAYDPDMAREPFFRPGELIRPTDVPRAVAEQFKRAELAQFEAELGAVDAELVQTYNFTYLSALSHDVNMLGGLLGALGRDTPPRVVDSAYWADGWAGSGAVELGDGVRATVTWLWLDQIEEYRCELTAYLRDGVHSLTFPAPYLGWPTTYASRRAAPGQQQLNAERTATSHGYVEELVHFHACVTEGLRCRTPAAEGRADIELLNSMFRTALASREAVSV